MESQIKKLRVTIDGLSQLVESLKPISHWEEPQGEIKINTEDIIECHKSLILAKAWLGKSLFELGCQTPYKTGYKTKDDIEPTADKMREGWIHFNESGNHIERVDYLRTEIEKVIMEVSLISTDKSFTREFSIARTNAYNHLCEAKFFLGFELSRIKEEK